MMVLFLANGGILQPSTPFSAGPRFTDPTIWTFDSAIGDFAISHRTAHSIAYYRLRPGDCPAAYINEHLYR